MSVKGVYASDQGIVGERRGDFASSVLKNNPNGSAPMFALSSGMESAAAADVVITWFEELHNTGRIGITNNASTGATLTVSTTDATNVIASQLYLVEASGEIVFVNSVSSTTVTVTRGFGTVAATAIDGSSTVAYMQRNWHCQ
jgi:ethanolamine utilization microcompartment shell protein EutS